MANKSVPRNHFSDAHKWTTIHVLQKQLSICTHPVVITIWAVRAELQYSGKIEIQKLPALFRNPQSFVDCSMERSIRYTFLIDLESIQHKLSSDYSLRIYFSRRFPYIDGPSMVHPWSIHGSSSYQPLQNVDFSEVGDMQFFFRDCTHILTRTQGKKFEDMFPVKIASKETSLMAR